MEEHEIMKAVLTKGDSEESSIRQEVEKIAEWISSESGRIRVTQKLSQIDAKRFPSPDLRWHLGIRSYSKAGDIMLRVYQALKDMNFEWHAISLYQVIVRPKLDEAADAKVKFDCSYYCGCREKDAWNVD